MSDSDSNISNTSAKVVKKRKYTQVYKIPWEDESKFKGCLGKSKSQSHHKLLPMCKCQISHKTLLDCFIQREIIDKSAVLDINYKNPRNRLPIREVYFGSDIRQTCVMTSHPNNNVGTAKKEIFDTGEPLPSEFTHQIVGKKPTIGINNTSPVLVKATISLYSDDECMTPYPTPCTSPEHCGQFCDGSFYLCQEIDIIDSASYRVTVSSEGLSTPSSVLSVNSPSLSLVTSFSISSQKGHTLNEGDSVHSVIEKASHSKDIFTPTEWHTMIRWAKTSGDPYIVKQMATNNFKNYKALLVTRGSTRNAHTREVALEDCYDGFRPISLDKFKDLNQLCATGIIPQRYHNFYKNLKQRNNNNISDNDSSE
ncbi:unnamed protein product [Diabrotica balteata]|uniref:Uncharacterized protein n=1 Tax=Diabrotica balteata TaxID=107213 RepID=A0A9N9T8D7_DIABA|nr:unnamed protein product [Diabrotica balteata]